MKDPSPPRPANKARWKGQVCQVAVLVLVGAQGYISYYFPSNPTIPYDDLGSVASSIVPSTTNRLLHNINRSASERARNLPPYNHTFPRWGPEGIDVAALIGFIRGLPNESSTTLYKSQRRGSTTEYFPETLYVWDSAGVWVSHVLRNRTVKHQLRHRVLPPEKAMFRAWDMLMMMDDENDNRLSSSQRRWARLRQVVSEFGGFPMVVWHGDYQAIDCNWLNYRSQHSVPLFTTCAHVNCTHALPFPTYKTIADSKPTSQHWRDLFDNRTATPGVGNNSTGTSAIRKLVWRGSLSGPLLNYTSARYRLAVFALEHAGHPLLDVGLHRIPPRHYHRGHKTDERLLVLEENLVPPMPSSHFGRYLAVLDTDGNSWSSRFGGLLCGSAVVLKVEPHYVDYFYRNLQPYVHYVPVRYDLGDLLEQTAWVTDPRNQPDIQEIVRNAHTWCQRHMTDMAVAEDMLDILNEYVSYLDRHSASWPELWKASKSALWTPEFDLRVLSFGRPRSPPSKKKKAKPPKKKNATATRGRKRLPGNPRRTRPGPTNRTALATTPRGHNASVVAAPAAKNLSATTEQ